MDMYLGVVQLSCKMFVLQTFDIFWNAIHVSEQVNHGTACCYFDWSEFCWKSILYLQSVLIWLRGGSDLMCSNQPVGVGVESEFWTMLIFFMASLHKSVGGLWSTKGENVLVILKIKCSWYSKSRKNSKWSDWVLEIFKLLK